MPNVHDDDQESLWFADESEWMDEPEDGFTQAAQADFDRAASERERQDYRDHMTRRRN